jgi:hypothetical protein
VHTRASAAFGCRLRRTALAAASSSLARGLRLCCQTSPPPRDRRRLSAPARNRFTDRGIEPETRLYGSQLVTLRLSSKLAAFSAAKGASDHSCTTAVADQCALPRAGCTVRQQPMPAVSGSPLADVLFRRSHARSLPASMRRASNSDRSRRFDINHPTLAQSFPSAV